MSVSNITSRVQSTISIQDKAKTSSSTNSTSQFNQVTSYSAVEQKKTTASEVALGICLFPLLLTGCSGGNVPKVKDVDKLTRGEMGAISYIQEKAYKEVLDTFDMKILAFYAVEQYMNPVTKKQLNQPVKYLMVKVVAFDPGTGDKIQEALMKKMREIKVTFKEGNVNKVVSLNALSYEISFGQSDSLYGSIYNEINIFPSEIIVENK